MAAGRFISISVAEDVRLNNISVEAQMMYLMTVPHLDRDGIINGNPSVLRGRVCPLREDFITKMPAIINEWVQSGLVIKYTNGDDTALWFKGFAKNNPLTHYAREKASKFAPPPGYIRGAKGLESVKECNTPDISGNPPDTSGKNPLRSEVEVEVDHSLDGSDEDDEPATPTELTEPTLSEQVFDRLEEEWSIVNPSQMDGHMALATRYGYEAWVAGLEKCTKGKRSSHAYVEKAICSAIDEKPSLAKTKPKPPPAYQYFVTDPVTGVRKEVLM